jgi:hypothetical protein
MERQGSQSATLQEENIPVTTTDRPAYEPPRVTAMDEAEVLKAFQFTSASTSWWVM